MPRRQRRRTVYMLRVRFTDPDEWSEPGEYTTRKERDYNAALNRIIGGIRTWSYEESRIVESDDESVAEVR